MAITLEQLIENNLFHQPNLYYNFDIENNFGSGFGSDFSNVAADALLVSLI